MLTLAIIIVSWNTRDLLRRCIASVYESLVGSGIACTIVVVDNASGDGTPAMLHDEYPQVYLVESGRNLGFAGGNNLALRILLGVGAPAQVRAKRLPAPDYLLLLNPDTEVVADAIPQLVQYLVTHPEVDIVGPQLRYPDGVPQPSRRRFPTRGTYFFESTPLEQRWPSNPWVWRYRCADTLADTEQPVDWLVGAALLVRRTAIERAGLLDPGFHMYSEELEWQRRIQRYGTIQNPGSTIVYLPSALIIHHEGKSSEQAPARRYIAFQRSRLRDARMVYGPRFAALLHAFLLLAYTVELVTEAIKWLLGHKRPLRTERLRIYWEVLSKLGRSQ
jgi:GT2 family glycosyltransferase